MQSFALYGRFSEQCADAQPLCQKPFTDTPVTASLWVSGMSPWRTCSWTKTIHAASTCRAGLPVLAGIWITRGYGHGLRQLVDDSRRLSSSAPGFSGDHHSAFNRTQCCVSPVRYYRDRTRTLPLATDYAVATGMDGVSAIKLGEPNDMDLYIAPTGDRSSRHHMLPHSLMESVHYLSKDDVCASIGGVYIDGFGENRAQPSFVNCAHPRRYRGITDKNAHEIDVTCASPAVGCHSTQTTGM